MNIANYFNNKILRLIILPTEKCNFRCKYCYEDFSLGQMQPSTIQSIKKLITHRMPELEYLHISWFGGEPLMAKNIIEEISTQTIATLKDYPNSTFNASMTTNGYYLDVPNARRLLELGVDSYQIALDGPQVCHNKTRVLADGQGTFEKIWDNLLQIHKSNLDINILLRIHLIKDNTYSMEDFIRTINVTFGKDKRFKVFLKPIENLGGSDYVDSYYLSQNEKISVTDMIKKSISNKDLFYTSDSLNVCYAAMANSFVIRPNGQICKCTVAFNSPENQIGNLKDDGKMVLDQSKLVKWFKGFERMDYSFLQCPLKSIR